MKDLSHTGIESMYSSDAIVDQLFSLLCPELSSGVEVGEEGIINLYGCGR
jgi:hypothetical protein